MKELNKIKELFDAFIKEAEELIENSEQSLKLEAHNFRVNSDNWKKITVDGGEYLENPEKDIWEILNEKARGEQLFTFEAMQRETKKAGKTVPTDEQFTELLKEKEDMPNLVFAGYRNTDGAFYNFSSLKEKTDGAFYHISSYAGFWSSLESGSYAWSRTLYSSDSTVYRRAYHKTYGFSVRCVKGKKIQRDY